MGSETKCARCKTGDATERAFPYDFPVCRACAAELDEVPVRRLLQARAEEHRAREAWALWLASLRSRVWVAWGRMCEHGGSQAAERVANTTHAARWWAKQRQACTRDVRAMREVAHGR